VRRDWRLMIAAAPLLTLTSCSSASRFAVAGPASLNALPPEHPSEERHPYFMPQDSSAKPPAGWVLMSGDSLQVLKPTSSGGSSVHENATRVYRYERATHRLSITEYRTADGKWHDWEGTVRVVGDSLEFLSHGRPSRLEAARPETLRVPASSVTALNVTGEDPTRAAITSVLAIALVSAILVTIAIWGLASVP